MTRYIDAEKVIEIAESNKAVLQSLADIVDIREIVNDVPTADVQTVIHAEWELVNEDENVYMCSNCGDEFITIDGTVTENHMLYCPFCGAKMDKKEERYVRDIFMTR